MARTKASVGAKVSAGKSSKARCNVAPPSSSSSSTGSGNRSSQSSSGGGNPVCPQPTPKWQRPITNFFISKDPGSDPDSDDGAGTSRSKKRYIIESDDEEQSETLQPEANKRPRNSVLDESIELSPLTGENSHKIVEYYQRNGEHEASDKVPSTSVENQETHCKNEETHCKNEETHCKNDETHSRNEETHCKNEETHSRDEETHCKNEETHSRDEETHSRDEETHSRDEETRSKNEETHSENGERLPGKDTKGKGRGKKTNKENLSTNIETKEFDNRKILKRDLEETSEESTPVSKKVKVH